MPILPFESCSINEQRLVETSPKSSSAIKSHFSVDSSTHQIIADASELDEPFSFQRQGQMQSWRSQEGFGNRPDDTTRSADYPIVPTRPPLRPTVSFGNVSTYSYYSSATEELEKKSQVVAFEEESESPSGRVYACVAVLCGLNILCGINVSSMATVLPTLAYDLSLSAVQSFWLVNAYLVSSTVVQPLSMRLSAAVGSKVILSSSLLLWTTGSIVSAVTENIAILLLGRVVTGTGAGAVATLVPLVLRQLLPRKHANAERSVSLSYWVGTFVGPVIGGALAQPSCWRYIFYLNLPICLISLVAFPFLLRLSSPDGASWKSLQGLDCIGWLLLSGFITCLSLAITWAGVAHSWSSLQTLIPLVIGAVCFSCWIVRSLYAQDSILPISIFYKPTGVISCLCTIIHGMVFMGLIYFTPFLHAVGSHLNPLLSGLMLSPYTLGLAILSLCGSIAIASFQRWSSWVSRAIVATGVGLLHLVSEGTIRSLGLPISLAVGMALGVLAGSLNASIQSTPTNDDEMTYAAPLSIFFTSLGSTLGLAVSSCVFVNRLGGAMHSTPSLLGNANMFTLDAVRMAYVTHHLTDDQAGLKAALVSAYMDALRWVWIVLCIFAGIAFLLNTYMLVAPRFQRTKGHDDRERYDSYTT